MESCERERVILQTEQTHQTKGLIRLTMVCNERCSFCNVPMEDYPSWPTPEEELQRQVSALVSSGARTATISGGEPTLLRKRLVALVKQIRDKGIPFVELQKVRLGVVKFFYIFHFRMT